MKRIDVLYFDGCPHYEKAIELAKDVAEELGIRAEINSVKVSGPDEAEALQFLGSPSVQLNGVDIEPSARERQDFGFSCRTYSGTGLPPREMLAAALNDDKGPASDRFAPVAAGSATSLGSVVAAIAASACRWLPLSLVAFGFSAGSLGSFFETARPYFLTAAAALLVAGFYLSYRREKACAAGSACETPDPKLKRFNRAALWVAAASVASFAAFPLYADVFLPEPIEPSIPVSSSQTDRSNIRVTGMSCKACAVAVHNALMKVPGVVDASVSYDSGTATVRTKREAPPSTGSLVAAVEKAGYETSLISSDPSELTDGTQERVMKPFLSEDIPYRGADVATLDEESDLRLGAPE